MVLLLISTAQSFPPWKKKLFFLFFFLLFLLKKELHFIKHMLIFCELLSLHRGSGFDSVLQEETGIGGGSQVSTVDALKPMNQEFSLDQQSLNSVVTSTGSLSGGFPVVSASYGYPSTLIQSLYEPEPQPQQQNSLFTNPSMSYSSSSANYGICSNELSPTWSKVSSLPKPSMPKQQLSGLHFSNNTAFWNSSAEALNDIRAGVFTSSQAQYQTAKFEEKPNCPNTLLNKVIN